MDFGSLRESTAEEMEAENDQLTPSEKLMNNREWEERRTDNHMMKKVARHEGVLNARPGSKLIGRQEGARGMREALNCLFVNQK